MTIRLQLKGIGRLETSFIASPPSAPEGSRRLKVLYCAICRTDAKMFTSGHRDLALPRVPGHEIAALDPVSNDLFTVWPGQACGSCRYCLDDRDNLCESMKIIGFHSDGGFASWIDAPEKCLVPAPRTIDPRILTLAEPVACALHCLERLTVAHNEKVIIYGGGAVGLIVALCFRARGARPLVIEQSEEKIAMAAQFCSEADITVAKETVESDFDIAVNCCDSHIAFSLCVSKLRKGGRLGFFSGLVKNEELDSNLINLLHYKENELYGSYGPRYNNMTEAVRFCADHAGTLKLLVHKVLLPAEAAGVLNDVAAGRALKYLIDFTSDNVPGTFSPYAFSPAAVTEPLQLPDWLHKLIDRVTPVERELQTAARKKIDLKTKPLGALGRVEDLAVQISSILGTLDPQLDSRRLVVFAGDHGVVEEGVSAYPAKVTRQMVENFLDGGAAINAFCRQYGIDLSIVDMGVNWDFTEHPSLISAKVRKGTRNFTLQPAMTLNETLKAIANGAEVFSQLQADTGCDIIAMGEMGIGNSSSASALIASITNIPVSELVGRGTGVDNKGLERKIEVLERALNLHNPDPKQPLQALSAVGGFEIAGIVGCVLAAAAARTCIVLDGLISTAAGLVAYQLCPQIADYLISGHRSVEHGQEAALTHIGIEPVLDLDMRLGEGTGAAITISLAELAARVMREMASFEDAGIEQKN